jgi:hypothetical protein
MSTGDIRKLEMASQFGSAEFLPLRGHQPVVCAGDTGGASALQFCIEITEQDGRSERFVRRDLSGKG